MKTDYINNIPNAERRFFTVPLEFRASEDGKQYFEGYAAKFNQETDLGYFREMIAPGAFEDVMDNDVRCLFNHDSHVILGRTAAGTCEISVDDVGLRYKALYNENDPDHVRVMEKIKRGDVSQSSFAFTIDRESWTNPKEGEQTSLRTIETVRQLYDVSPVTYPAYADTTVGARSLDSIKAEKDKADEAAAKEKSEQLRQQYKLKLQLTK